MSHELLLLTVSVCNFEDKLWQTSKTFLQKTYETSFE